MTDFSRRTLLKAVGVGLSAAALDRSGALAQAARSGGAEKKAGKPDGTRVPARRDAGRPAYRRSPVTFSVHRLGSDHAEGLAVIDMNHDGLPDITSGAYWYENPGAAGGEWKRHKFRQLAPILPSVPPGGDGKLFSEFVADNGEFAIDVNHDGALDLVTSSWQNDGIWWFENPKKTGEMWKPHLICHSKETEGFAFSDLDGDGHPELLASHYGRQGMLWINFAGPEPAVHSIGGHDEDGHGCGIADIDGDGKADVISIHGWFRNIDAAHDKWEWRGEWDLGDCGFPIIAYDVNNDGRMDLIYGRGHDYGLYWLEQTIRGGKRAWRPHLIDDSFSQVHALKMADLDGDGEPELLAGKRYRGHNGADPGSYKPLAIYYYKINRATASFTRYPASYNGTAGAGTQFVVTDIDGDGDADVLVAGKTGLHWLENLKMNTRSREAREKELLLNTDWPFPGEGTE